MNQFLESFSNSIKSFWDVASEEEKEKLLKDIFNYASANPEKFKQEMQEIQFDKELMPLAIVLEALSIDTDKWGQFYIDTLDNIFEQAKNTDRPQDILSCLLEFAYIEKANGTFIQRIVDRISKETDSENLLVRLAAIGILPGYLKNPSVRNKSSITESLKQKLFDSNWKVRYVAFKSLSYENMLPERHKLSVTDQIRKLIFGAPSTI